MKVQISPTQHLLTASTPQCLTYTAAATVTLRYVGYSWLQSYLLPIPFLATLCVLQTLPSLVCLAVFKMTTLQESTSLQRFLLNCWQSAFNGGGIILDRKPLNLERAAGFTQTLIDLGAKETFLTPIDGMARIQCLRLTFEDFKAKVEKEGGEVKWEDNRHIVKVDKNSALFLPLKRLWPQLSEGLFMIFDAQDSSLTPPERPLCAVFSPFGHLLGMHKGLMTQMLGAGFDICAYNHRGAPPSTGTPCEGGFYNDLAALIDELQKTYANDQLWTIGECAGTFVPAWLRTQEKYLGINSIDLHPPASVSDVVASVNPIARGIFKRYATHLQGDPSLYPPQNLFDVKQHKVPQGKRGTILIGTTPGDTMTPPEQTDALIHHYKSNSFAVETIVIKSQGGDPHRADLAKDKKTLIHVINAMLTKQ